MLAFSQLPLIMKIKLHHIFFLVMIAASATISSAFAQDSGNQEYEVIDTDRERNERDKIISSPGESDTRYSSKVSSAPVTKDSILINTVQPTISASKPKTEKVTPAAKPLIEKDAKDQDDSILSFNFLYYIIQKYKLQDIVD